MFGFAASRATFQVPLPPRSNMLGRVEVELRIYGDVIANRFGSLVIEPRHHQPLLELLARHVELHVFFEPRPANYHCLKLLKETYIILKKLTNILDAVSAGAQTFDAQTEGEAHYFFRIVTDRATHWGRPRPRRPFRSSHHASSCRLRRWVR